MSENAGNPVVTFKGELIEDINDPIRAEIRFLRMEGSVFVPVFINMTIDVCDLMLQTGKHPMVSMVMKEMLKENQFPTGCPMKKGQYSLNNFSPNIGLLGNLIF